MSPLDNLKEHIQLSLMNAARQTYMKQGFIKTLTTEFPKVSKEDVDSLAELLVTAWLSGVWEITSMICGSKESDDMMIEMMAQNIAEDDENRYEDLKKQIASQVREVRKQNTNNTVTYVEGTNKVH